MQVTLLHGYPDYIGRRFAFVGYGNGPASYVTGGDPVALSRYDNYIDDIAGDGLTASGNYIARAISAAGPRATFKLKWYPIATPGTEVSPGTNLSAEVLTISGFGGVY